MGGCSVSAGRRLKKGFGVDRLSVNCYEMTFAVIWCYTKKGKQVASYDLAKLLKKNPHFNTINTEIQQTLKKEVCCNWPALQYNLALIWSPWITWIGSSWGKIQNVSITTINKWNVNWCGMSVQFYNYSNYSWKYCNLDFQPVIYWRSLSDTQDRRVSTRASCPPEQHCGECQIFQKTNSQHWREEKTAPSSGDAIHHHLKEQPRISFNAAIMQGTCCIVHLWRGHKTTKGRNFVFCFVDIYCFSWNIIIILFLLTFENKQ